MKRGPAYDIYYIDDIQDYPGHREQTGIEVISSGKTTLPWP
ncbi:MAG: hypothetical protein WC294_07640 [Methanoregula sp.]|jgi:hypothetical protein